MSISTITVGGQTVTLVAAPSALLARAVDFKMGDAVGIVPSVFTGQMQRQMWPGAERWGMTLTMPPLRGADADLWEGFLLDMQGMANAAQFADPRRPSPRGSIAGTPLTDNTVAGGNIAMRTTLGTKGWTAGATGVLRRGDYLQIGYHMHRTKDDVNADGSGKALIRVWPSIRETPADGAAINVATPKGLFCLAANERTWSGDITRLTRLSVQLQEYR